MSSGVLSFCRKSIVATLLLSAVVVCALNFSTPAEAVAGTNEQLNFQGRLYNAQGATVPDGYYNIQFKIYQDGDGLTADNTTGSPAGTLKWTESYLNNNSHGVIVKNGFMSVQLGSVNPFGNNVDWNQDTLWLSMNIAGTNASCTPFASCSPDGEMLPMKRLSSATYAMNTNRLGGLTSSQFLQIAQGIQTDTSNGVSSIAVNKTGTGNIVNLQSGGVDAFTINNIGNVEFGANNNHTIAIATAGAGTAGKALTIAGGAAGTGASALEGGDLIVVAGNGGGTNGNGGDIAIDAGQANGSGADGTISIGSGHASTIQLGNTSLSSGTQNINIGNNNTAGGTTNVTIGSGGSATGGTTTIQAKGNITLNTNGITRATFDTGNDLYLGNGITAATPNNFTISGTGSSAPAVLGATLTVKGGSSTTGNTNGGNLILTGGSGFGTGANGLVIINTPTFSTVANDANCYTGGALVSGNCTVSMASVNSSGAILVGFNAIGKIATLPDPTISTAGRIVYLTAALNSQDFTLTVNGGGIGNQIAMRQNTTATMIWNGNDWTAAGASSSTTLQSAYDNTMQSAGGAELIVSRTATTNGFTIRDSSVSPVDGNLLSVQTSSAAGLFSVNSNVTEYASDAGAETSGTLPSNFPASTWEAINGSTISRYTTTGDYVATGQASALVATSTTAGSGMKNTLKTALTASMTYNVSFGARLLSGTFTDMDIYYSIDGSTATSVCKLNIAVRTSVWDKVNCTFTAPASGITAANAIFIRQTGGGTARSFYVDNLSVTIAADYNYATDGGADNSTTFATNWSFVNATTGAGTVSRNTADGYNASTSATVALTTGASNAGIRNKLSINPLTSTLYRITIHARLASGTFNDFKVRYSRDGSTGSAGNYVDCLDYNTQTLTTSGWTKVTCYVTTDSSTATNPHVYFVEGSSAVRTFHVDGFSMTLATVTTPNVQIGGGNNGGPVALFTLDRAASAPIASDNDALLGSMYYDTTLGKLQCYEADGWGACGSSPDDVVTLSPEFTNAVMHGTGVGTMTSDICSSTLNINNGTSGQPTICGSNETWNFYRWTSPQASAQTYSIYVTYQLPSTFKAFASGETTIVGRTDSANSTVQYQIYRSDSGSGLTPCGSTISVASGSVSSWQIGYATGAADPSACEFSAGNSIVFKIDMISSQNANAYVGNLNFTFSNR